MNKQNQVSECLNFWSRSDHKKFIEPDNSVLCVTMPENIKNQLTLKTNNLEKTFEQCFHESLDLKSYFKSNPQYTLVDSKERLEQVQKILEKQKLVFIKIFEETYRSFKGFCSWISITTVSTTYLIDLMILRKHIESKGLLLFSNPNIIKIGLSMKQQISGLQRDFNVFTRTVLDLNEMLELYGLAPDLKSLVKQRFPKLTMPSKIGSGYFKRPSSVIEMQFISASSLILPQILCLLKQKLEENKTLLEAFLISNKLCLNVFEINLDQFSESFQKTLKTLDARQARICKKLLKWRVHTARIRDQSPQYILSSKIIHQIINEGINSMGQLLSLYEQYSNKDICRDYDETLLQIINSQSSKINIAKCQNEVNQCKSINDFVKMMGWADCNWKNSNSDSVKLFKEIISMDPIESSIIENELNQTKGRALSNDSVMDLFGYVEYFAKGDAKGLERQYAKFLEGYEEQGKESGSERSLNQSDGIEKRTQEKDFIIQPQFKIPQSIEQIYDLANAKKKSMNKDKKKSIISEEKEEPFVLNAQEFLKSIGWN